MLKIFVVDDEESIRFTFKLHIEDQGHEVKTIENPLEMLETCASCRLQAAPYCDAIFVDMTMPSMTGLEFFEQTQNICSLTSNSKFLMSGALNPQMISRAREMGIMPFHKPLTLETLDKIISQVSKYEDRVVIGYTKEIKCKS